MAAAQKTSPKKAPVSVFGTAPVVVKQQATIAKKDQLVPVAGLRRYGAMAVLEKLIKSYKEVWRNPIRDVADARWMEEAMKHQTRPDNFRAVEATFDAAGVATCDNGTQASVEFRKRATNSPLKDEEVAILDADEIPYDRVPLVAGSSVFAINSRYEADAALMQRVGEAIASVEGLPADFIIQPVKRVVSEDTLKAVFKRREKETDSQYVDRLNRLIPVVRVMGIKPVSDIDPLEALAIVMDELEPAAETAQVKAAS